MATAYLIQNISLAQPTSVVAGQTDIVVSKEESITQDIAQNFLSIITVGAATIGVGEQIFIKLQNYTGVAWIDVDFRIAVVPITAAGTYYIYLDEGVPVEASVLPLFNRIRLVVTTGSTSTCRVDSVIINKNLN